VESSHDFSEPSSPKRRFLGRRKPLSRKKKIGAVVALTAAVGTGGIVQTNMASAATIGTVWVQVSAEDLNNWGAGWGRAWDDCQRNHPETRSVELHSASFIPEGGGYYQEWYCRDTN
jgi:hypothetical protein